MRKITAFSLILSLLGLIACENEHKQPIHWTKEQSSKLNRELAQSEAYAIKQYLSRRKSWKMIKTGTGLQYMIFQHGKGLQAKSGMYALVNYEISLLDGTVCYTSDSLGASEFLVDHSEVESGLQEGIQYLHVGDKAIFIMPSHLAHGLLGDMNKIPPLEPVIFKIELLKLTEKQ